MNSDAGANSSSVRRRSHPLPIQVSLRDFADAAALDDIIELVRRVPMLLRLFVAIKHLDPTGERRKRRTAGHPYGI